MGSVGRDTKNYLKKQLKIIRFDEDHKSRDLRNIMNLEQNKPEENYAKTHQN